MSREFADLLAQEAEEAARAARAEVYRRHQKDVEAEVAAIVQAVQALQERAHEALALVHALELPVPPELQALTGAPTAGLLEATTPREQIGPTAEQARAATAAPAPAPEPPAAPAPEDAPAPAPEGTPYARSATTSVKLAAEAALDIQGEFSNGRLVQELGITRGMAGDAIRQLYHDGKLFVARFPERTTDLVFVTDKERSIHVAPQSRVPLREMPALAGAGNRMDILQEATARAQSMLARIMEDGQDRTWVPREVHDALDPKWAEGFPYSRVAGYLRDMARTDPPVIERLPGHGRRGQGQQGGRPATEYRARGSQATKGTAPAQAPEARTEPASAPTEPARAKRRLPKGRPARPGKPTTAEGMDYVRKHSPLTTQELAEAFGQDLRWAGQQVLGQMHKSGWVKRCDDGRWQDTRDQPRGAEPKPEPAPPGPQVPAEPASNGALPGEAPARPAMVALRGWLHAQAVGDAFPPSRAAGAAGGQSTADALALLEELVNTGEVIDVSPAPDHRLFSRAEDAGAEARRQARQRMKEATPTRRGEVVAGTGSDIKRGLTPEMRDLVLDIIKAGGNVAKVSNGHMDVLDQAGRKVRDERGKPVQLPSTPSDVRAARNARATLRGLGLAV